MKMSFIATPASRQLSGIEYSSKMNYITYLFVLQYSIFLSFRKTVGGKSHEAETSKKVIEKEPKKEELPSKMW